MQNTHTDDYPHQLTPYFTTPFSLLIMMVISALFMVTSCSNVSVPYVIDQTHQAQGKSQRISSIIIHYTAEDDAESLRLLTTTNVSAHYLIPLADNNKIYQLVADNERAWHAGSGEFAGRRLLNDTSIGIEIVNEGIKKQYRQSPNIENDGYHPPEHFVEFSDTQIEKVAQLIKNLSEKYDIEPTHIIAHSDMAPSRKIDPGAKFPWEKLYKEYGVGAWYDDADKRHFMNSTDLSTISVKEVKQLLTNYGYAINNSDEWDKASRDVVYAFQLHFRPQQLTGKVDLETYAILKALHKKYVENTVSK